MKLTKRQCEVADRLVEGMTIAAIADDLGLTESRVNQIIRALKDRLEVDTQAGIVGAYQRAHNRKEIVTDSDDEPVDELGDESLVPEILNTPHPILYRLVAISAGSLFLAAAFFLLATFAIALSEASDPYVQVSAGR